MKVVIFAGGYGTRISEESHLKPKPMIEISGTPILWNIMKYYSHYGFNDFIICLGYKGDYIKKYFLDYYTLMSDVTFDFANGGEETIHNNVAEPWKVTLIDTGLDTMTGGRLKRVKKYLGDETFMLTYGDGVSDVDLHSLLEKHKCGQKICTLTAVQPGGRFGDLEINHEGVINSFTEKKKEDGNWINGGFMVLEPEIMNYINGDETVFERDVLEKIAKENKLLAYRHHGFWQCMDTLRDKIHLEELIESGKAPWIVW